MTKETFNYFMREQKKEIEKHKWIESEKAGYDKGLQCCFDWIDKYSDNFYNSFIRSSL